MSEIPEDVMAKAEATYSELVAERGWPTTAVDTVPAIARAIFDERERCAQIADRYAHRDTGREIADAIRTPTPTH